MFAPSDAFLSLSLLSFFIDNYAERVRSVKPTNTPFTADELRELRDTGRVSGYEGHHVESVSNNPAAARDPKNIKFVKGRAAHLREPGGNWRNRTPLKPR